MSESRKYRLRADEALPDAVGRVARGRIDHALDELHGRSGSTPEEAVHEARKDMKKLRALLRLSRDELAEKIHEHHAFIEEQGTLAERRRRNLMNEVVALAAGRLRRDLEAKVHDDPAVQELFDEVVARRLDPASAAAKLLERE